MTLGIVPETGGDTDGRAPSTTDALIYVFDLDGRYGYVSRNAGVPPGTQRPGVSGRTWQELGLPVTVMQPFEQLWLQVQRTGEPGSRRTEFETPAGDVRSYE